MRGVVVLMLSVSVAVAAPVPSHLMPRTDVELRYNPARHPLGSSFDITIRNTGPADLQIWTDRPYGTLTFLDVEILNERGERVSRFYPWNSPADQGATAKHLVTIAAGKSYSPKLPLFNSVPEKSLTPGKYKVRVRFKYQDHDAVSDWLTVEVTELQIRTKHIELGP